MGVGTPVKTNFEVHFEAQDDRLLKENLDIALKRVLGVNTVINAFEAPLLILK